jgi:DNA-binding IscR family transcriptional regulator
MLQIIEAVDGPMSGQQTLFEASARSRFTNKIESVYNKAVNQAKAVFEKTRMADLIG